MSGKEAEVYVVRSRRNPLRQGLKELKQRSFQKQTQYLEGRKAATAALPRHGNTPGSGARSRRRPGRTPRSRPFTASRPPGCGCPGPIPLRGGAADGADGRRGRAAAPRLNDLQLSAEAARQYHRLLIGRWCACSAPGGARRPLRVQRAGCRRRPGDHRSAPGDRRRRQQQRRPNLRAGRRQHRRYFGRFAPELLIRPTPRRSGTSTRGSCTGVPPVRPLREERGKRPTFAAPRGIDDSPKEALARELGGWRIAEAGLFFLNFRGLRHRHRLLRRPLKGFLSMSFDSLGLCAELLSAVGARAVQARPPHSDPGYPGDFRGLRPAGAWSRPAPRGRYRRCDAGAAARSRRTKYRQPLQDRSSGTGRGRPHARYGVPRRHPNNGGISAAGGELRPPPGSRRRRASHRPSRSSARKNCRCCKRSETWPNYAIPRVKPSRNSRRLRSGGG